MDKTRNEATAHGATGLPKILALGARGAIFALCGYLSGLCALPFGARPFGIALLAASDKNAVFVLVGLCASSFAVYDGYAAAVSAGVSCALFLLRILLRLTLASPFESESRKRSLGELLGALFCEPRGYRVCAAAIASLALSFSFLAGGGFLYYDLFALLINVALAPLASLALCAFFRSERRARGESHREGAAFAGFLTLCAICSGGGAPLKIYGVSVCVALGIFVSLRVTARVGAWRGSLTAAAVGLPYSLSLCPIFGIAVLAHKGFSKISAGLVSTATLFGALFYSFYVRGIHALDGVAGGIITAALLFSVSARFRAPAERGKKSEEGAEATERAKGGAQEKEKAEEELYGERCAVLSESELDGVRLYDINRRMTELKESFSRLYALFENIKLKFPRRAELEGICGAAFESSCVGCPEQAHCRRAEPLGDQCKRLSAELGAYGRVESRSFSRSVVSRCARLPDIIDEINYNYSIRFGGAGASEGDFFSLGGYGYKAISELFVGGCDEEEYIADAAASAALCERLERLGLCVSGAIVYGERRRRVLLRAKDGGALESARIAACVRETLGFEVGYEEGSLRKLGKNGALELSERRRFSARSYACRYSAEGADMCGDSIELFENRDGYFYCVMSDGMGSGRDAALTSELSVGFLKNMLGGSELSEALVEALNSLLRSRTDGSAKECSATLDLLRFDSVSGRATFCKCGAAPSYVYRSGNLFKLRSRTMPLGILEHADAKITDIKLDEGDVVIMMSDGVSGGREECPYLFDLLRQNIASEGIERTAELIVKYARSEGSRDDISVTVIRIERAEAAERAERGERAG